MALNKGKQFEQIFKSCWQKSFPEGTIDRIYDSVSGYKAVSNVCDFIAYNYPNIYYCECKSHQGNTFPWTAFSQYDKLKAKVDIKGVRVGVILWMIDHDTIVYLPVKTITQMMQDGHKSFNIKMLQENKYRIIVIPSVKKRVFLESDYSIMAELNDGD